MTCDLSKLSVDQRMTGLTRSQLLALKDRCADAIKEIEDGGRVDMWVVSDDSVNLYWDVSYDRACHYLTKELHGAKGSVTKFNYELTKQRIFANEVKSYEDDYGQTWASVQAELDAEAKEQA